MQTSAIAQKCDNKSEDIVSKGGTNGKSHGWYGMVTCSIYKSTKFLTEIRGDLGSRVNREDFKV